MDNNRYSLTLEVEEKEENFEYGFFVLLALTGLVLLGAAILVFLTVQNRISKQTSTEE
jgi:hypothetical protein